MKQPYLTLMVSVEDFAEFLVLVKILSINGRRIWATIGVENILFF